MSSRRILVLVSLHRHPSFSVSDTKTPKLLARYCHVIADGEEANVAWDYLFS